MADLIELESMGGVVARARGDDVEIVVCGFDAQPGHVIWGLPKGTPEDGETREQTAVREVTEETGLEVSIDEFVQSIEYCFERYGDGADCHKVVYFYLMSANGGDLSLHDHEFDYVRWLPATEAIRTLTYDNEVKVVKNALHIISKKARAG